MKSVPKIFLAAMSCAIALEVHGSNAMLVDGTQTINGLDANQYSLDGGSVLNNQGTLNFDNGNNPSVIGAPSPVSDAPISLINGSALHPSASIGQSGQSSNAIDFTNETNVYPPITVENYGVLYGLTDLGAGPVNVFNSHGGSFAGVTGTTPANNNLNFTAGSSSNLTGPISNMNAVLMNTGSSLNLSSGGILASPLTGAPGASNTTLNINANTASASTVSGINAINVNSPAVWTLGHSITDYGAPGLVINNGAGLCVNSGSSFDSIQGLKYQGGSLTSTDTAQVDCPIQLSGSGIDLNGLATHNIFINGVVSGSADINISGVQNIYDKLSPPPSDLTGNVVYFNNTANNFIGTINVGGGYYCFSDDRVNGDARNSFKIGNWQGGGGLTGLPDGLEVPRDITISPSGARFYDMNGTNLFSGQISGDGYLIYANSGTLSLSNNNSFTGPLAVLYGTVEAVSDESLGNNGVQNVANGTPNRAVCQLQMASAVLRIAAEGFDSYRLMYVYGTPSTIDNNGFNPIFRGPLYGSTPIYFSGTGTTTLMGHNPFDGGYYLNTGTTLAVGPGGTLGCQVNNASGASNTSLVINASTTTMGAITGITNIVVNGPAIWTLAHALTGYDSQALVVNSGATLQFVAGGSIDNQGVMLNGGMLDVSLLDGNSVNWPIVLAGAGGTLTSSTNNLITIGGPSAVISGTGKLTFKGGTIALTNANNYTGTLLLKGSNLNYSAEDQLGDPVNVLQFDQGGGLINLAANVNPSRAINLLPGGGQISVSGPNVVSSLITSINNTGNVGVLALGGGSSLTLSNVNNTYHCNTQINPGTVIVGTDSNLGNTNPGQGTVGAIVFNGGNLQLSSDFVSARNIQMMAGGTLDNQGHNISLSGVISGNAGLNLIGSGQTTLAGNNTLTAPITIGLQSNLSISADNNLGRAGLAAAVPGNGLIIDGGTLTFSNNYTGPFTWRPINIGSNGATIVVNDNNLTLNGLISGQGPLNLNHTQLLSITGQNTFTGPITVNSATLALNNDASLGNPANTLSLQAGGGVMASANLNLQRSIIISTNALINNNSFSLSLNGPITGTGMLNFTGTGTSQLNNSLQLSGTLNLNPMSRLQLNHDLDANQFNNQGVMLINSNNGPARNLTGTLNHMASATMVFNLTSSQAYDQLRIFGAVNCAASSQVLLTLSNGGLGIRDNDSFSLVVADNFNGVPTLNYIDPLGLFSFDTAIANNSLKVTGHRKPLSQAALTPSTATISQAIEALPGDDPHVMALLSQLYNSSNRQALTSAVSQFDVTHEHLTTKQALKTNQNLISSRLFTRIDALSDLSRGIISSMASRYSTQHLRMNYVSGYSTSRLNIIPLVLGNLISQSATNDTSGFRAQARGVGVLVDKSFDRHHLGVGLTQSNIQMKSLDVSPRRTKVNSLQGLLYGRLSHQAWLLDSVVGFTRNHNRSLQVLPLAGLESESRYLSTEAMMQIRVGYSSRGDSLKLVPLVSLQYSRMQQNAYQQSGAGSLNQKVAAIQSSVLKLGTGFNLTYEEPGQFWFGNVHAMAYRDKETGPLVVNSNFVLGGGNISTINLPTPENSYVVGCGVSFWVGKVVYEINYDLELRTGFRNQAGTLKFRLAY